MPHLLAFGWQFPEQRPGVSLLIEPSFANPSPSLLPWSLTDNWLLAAGYCFHWALNTSHWPPLFNPPSPPPASGRACLAARLRDGRTTSTPRASCRASAPG